MPCTVCPHPTCRHSVVRKGVTACPECESGTVVLDPVSAPAWRLDCNSCSFLIYLPKDLHAVTIPKDKDPCQVRHTALHPHSQFSSQCRSSCQMLVAAHQPASVQWMSMESAWYRLMVGWACWSLALSALSFPGKLEE